MIKPKHNALINLLSKSEGVRMVNVHIEERKERLYNIYYKKTSQYWLRDFKQNKTLSLLHYHLQEDRAISNIMAWYHRKI